MTHCIDKQRTYIELDSQGDKKYSCQHKNVHKSMRKIKKATVALGLATIICTSVVANTITMPQDFVTSTQKSQQTDNSDQNDKQSSLKDAMDNNFKETIFEGTQQEFEDLVTFAANIKKRKSGATLEELSNFKASIENMVNYAIDSFSAKNSMFGGGDNIAYAYKSAGVDSVSVAKYVVESIDLDPKETINIKSMIDELQNEYKTLPASAIGMVLSQNLISKENNQYWRRETTKGNVSYIDSIVNGTLKILSDPKSVNNYASMKQDYARLQKLVQELNSLSRKQDLATDAVNKQIRLHTIYKGTPSNNYAKRSVNRANQDAYNYSVDLAESALEIFNKIYAVDKNNSEIIKH